MFVAGTSLLAMQPWARHLILVECALELLSMPHLSLGLHMDQAPSIDLRPLQSYLPHTVMLACLVADLVVYLTLTCYPNVAQTFGGKTGVPELPDRL